MTSRRQESEIDKNLKNKFNMPGEARATPPSICFGEEGKKDFRQLCKYGRECYQKNPMHHQKFRHPKGDDTATLDETEEEFKEPVPKKAKIEAPVEKDDDKFLLKEKLDVDEKNCDDVERTEIDGANSSKPTEEFPTPIDEEETLVDDLSEKVPNFLDWPKDPIKRVEQLFLTKFPEDFLQFWEFCKGINRENPQDALLKTCGLALVGPYEIISGKEFETTKLNDYLCHYRYYRDPPEFQTVLASTDESSNFHIGYFRDSPDEAPAFVGAIGGKKGTSDYENYKIVIMGDNLFAAIYLHLTQLVNTVDPFKMTTLQKLKQSVHVHATMKNQDQSFSLEAKTTAMKGRDKRKVFMTFHGAGGVVPYDKSSQVGYREIPETNSSLKKMLSKIIETQKLDDEEAKNKAFDALQELVTNVQFANDEGDPGMGLELGIDLLVFGGNCLNSTARHLLTVAYELLNREAFAKITNAHLNRRSESAAFFKAK